VDQGAIGRRPADDYSQRIDDGGSRDYRERKAHIMEHIAHMVPMLVLAGLMAGWTAEAVSRGGGYGLITDMILGLIGSLLVGGIAWVVSREAGMLGMFVIGGAGAVLAVAGQRRLWRSHAVPK
jgi:uncharacterized membrane protein YeaQ/YmgE (transglycosylase-associated protein family)